MLTGDDAPDLLFNADQGKMPGTRKAFDLVKTVWTLSEQLDGMEKSGLIYRHKNEQDK